jgi:tetratricopeptide (TPR) repeat protein
MKEFQMLKKALVFSLAVICSTAALALDYKAEWDAAYKLYHSRKYAEAMKAFSNLAEKTDSANDKYNCYRYAGFSARSLKKYDEAIAFADKIAEIKNPYKYYSKLRKIEFMYNARKYKDIVAEFPASEIATWPKALRSEGFYYLGYAYYNLKNGEEAKKVFQACLDNATSSYWKGNANLRLGYTTRYHLKKSEDAFVFFSAVIEEPKAYVYHKCEACAEKAAILINQKKYDEAMAAYGKMLQVKKLNGYWIARITYYKASLLQRMGKKDEAIKYYKAALAVKGCAGWVKSNCQNKLKALESKPAAK